MRAKDRVPLLMTALELLYPEPRTALDFRNPFELLIATILSAQCTDRMVNLVTPGLFARFPTPAALASGDPQEITELIRRIGLYRNKAKNIRETAAILVRDYGGEVPADLDALTRLPGVGRKTANVVLGDGFGITGITVDTHVGRLSRRLGLTRHQDPVKVERVLNQLIPQAEWTRFSHRLILHGRAVCAARKPRCGECTLSAHCPRVGVETGESDE